MPKRPTIMMLEVLLLCICTRGALGAGVAAEGEPLLGPLIGPAQEREAIARRAGQHHIRHPHQHHYSHQSSPVPLARIVEGVPNPCVVTPEQLAATARDTASRVVDQSCNKKELTDRLHNLESQISEQFNVLKTMILNLEDKVGAMDMAMDQFEGKTLAAISKSRCNSGDDDPYGTQDDVADDDYDSPADIGSFGGGAVAPSVRNQEISRLNNTVHTEYAPPGSGNTMAGCGAGTKVFTYYWRVQNLNYKMTNWNVRRSQRSPSFYVGARGYRMYLRLYPRQSNSGEHVFAHVGITRGDYDNSLPWPFRLKLRLGVLDQVATIEGPDSARDLVSRLWDPTQLCSTFNWQKPTLHNPDNYECVGLGFQQNELRTRNYIRQDSVVLRLTVCLDS